MRGVCCCWRGLWAGNTSAHLARSLLCCSLRSRRKATAASSRGSSSRPQATTNTARGNSPPSPPPGPAPTPHTPHTAPTTVALPLPRVLPPCVPPLSSPVSHLTQFSLSSRLLSALLSSGRLHTGRQRSEHTNRRPRRASARCVPPHTPRTEADVCGARGCGPPRPRSAVWRAAPPVMTRRPRAPPAATERAQLPWPCRAEMQGRSRQRERTYAQYYARAQGAWHRPVVRRCGSLICRRRAMISRAACHCFGGVTADLFCTGVRSSGHAAT